jgi:CelD/BcsL family acetyltransferase involved in cellulose biosynthesis
MIADTQSTTIPVGPAQPGAAARVVRSLDDLDQLAAAWDALAGGAGSPMQQFIWARACAESFCRRGDQLHVVTVGPAGRPTAIAPLIRRRGLGRLELLGARELYEPTDFLYADRPALDALAGTLSGLGRPICLHRVLADSPTIAALQELYRRRGWVLCRPVSGSPSIPIDVNWQESEKFNGKMRRNFRRRLRLAEAVAPVNFEILSPSPVEVEPLLDEAYRVEAAGWKGERGTALAKDATRGAFFRRYAAAAAREGILRLGFMRLGGRAIAMHLAVECGERFWLFKQGYDEAFARFSPGTLLTLHLLTRAVALGLRSFELLGVLEPSKRMWSPVERPCVTPRAYPYGPRGLVLLGSDTARLALLGSDTARLALSRLRKLAHSRCEWRAENVARGG